MTEPTEFGPEAAQAQVTGRGKSEVATMKELDELERSRIQTERDRAELERAKEENELRRKYAKGILYVLGGQLALSNIVFVVYGWANGWQVPGSAMAGWLGSAVAQAVALAVVVTKSLFPSRD